MAGRWRVILALGLLGPAIGCAPGCSRAPAGSGASPGPTRAASGQRPNLLLVTLDTVRADVLQELGSRQEIAPNLERLVRNGFLWTNAETPTPLTLPAHASLMTGLYPAAHGVRNNAQHALAASHPTLATILAGAGYATGGFVAAYPLARQYGVANGFQTWDDELDPRRGVEAERPAAEVNARAIPWLLEARDRPFFLWVHYFEAHDPYTPPEPYRSRFSGNPYHGEVATADGALGELLDALRRSGEAERTLVVVASDHGEGLGAHGEAFHGLLLYRTTSHVLVALSGGPLAGRSGQLEAPTSLVDVAPTVLALLGVPAPPGMQGLDLSAGLGQARSAGPANRRAVPAESYYAWFEFRWSPLRSLVRDGWRYIAAPTPELYDLGQDPSELVNLAAERPEQAADMRRELLEQETAHLSPAAGQASRPTTEEERERLASLGYLGGGGETEIDPVQVPTGPDPKDMMRVYARYSVASGHLNRGDAAAALVLLDEVVAADPANPVFRAKRARTLADLGRLAEAEREYRAILEREPRRGIAYWDLSILYDFMDRPAEAVEVLRALEGVDPGWVGLGERLAGLLERAGRRDEAIGELCKQAAREKPAQAARLLAGAAAMRARGGDRLAAESIYREARALDASLPETMPAPAAGDGRPRPGQR